MTEYSLDIFALARQLSEEETTQALGHFLSHESFQRLSDQTWPHMAVCYALVARLQELKTQEWLLSVGFVPAVSHSVTTGELRVQPLSEPRGLVFAPKFNHFRNMIAPQLPKHSQSILAIDSQFFYERGFSNGVHVYPFARLFEQVAPYLSLRQRAFLEKNPAYRQVLPYKVITQRVDGERRLLAYRRLRQGGEQRLYGLTSIGFGGHADLEDVVTYPGVGGSDACSTIDLESTLRGSSRRELGEEVHFINAIGGRLPYVPALQEIVATDTFIHYNLREQLGERWSIEQDVHAVHVAFVYEITADPELVFVSGEPDKIEMLPPMTVRQLLHGDYELEEWSRLLLLHMAGLPQR